MGLTNCLFSRIIFASTVGFAAVGCGGSAGATLGSEQDAKAAAVSLVGGVEAMAAERVVEDDLELWEVGVHMPNTAELEVLLIIDDGVLFEVADKEGPFDYDSLDPLPGHLTYAAARDKAFMEIEGQQVAWEVKLLEDRYFYEFYVRDPAEQLWEIKLWSDDGSVFVIEEKDEID